MSITVHHEGKGWVARRVSLGNVKKGQRMWTWNGRNDDGRVVIDGNSDTAARQVLVTP